MRNPTNNSTYRGDVGAFSQNKIFRIRNFFGPLLNGGKPTSVRISLKSPQRTPLHPTAVYSTNKCAARPAPQYQNGGREARNARGTGVRRDLLSKQPSCPEGTHANIYWWVLSRRIRQGKNKRYFKTNCSRFCRWCVRSSIRQKKIQESIEYIPPGLPPRFCSLFIVSAACDVPPRVRINKAAKTCIYIKIKPQGAPRAQQVKKHHQPPSPQQQQPR